VGVLIGGRRRCCPVLDECKALDEALSIRLGRSLSLDGYDQIADVCITIRSITTREAEVTTHVRESIKLRRVLVFMNSLITQAVRSHLVARGLGAPTLECSFAKTTES
jgi:hypothetical protein